MTDFDKVRGYYKDFDENNRLRNDSSGRFEFDMTMKKIEKYIPEEAIVLDLGGATGVYTFPLAKKGHKIYLADLSEDLINQAKEKVNILNEENVISCDVVNAVDLSIYEDDKFDVVLIFGPLYHLLDEVERIKCVSEVNRVLKKNGLVFASFIPYLSGSIAIVDRYFKHPEQVNIDNLDEVFKSGKFNNADNNGFQEGYYPKSGEIVNLFKNNGFSMLNISSIRGFGYEKEDKIYDIKDKMMFDKVIDLIEQTSNEDSIVETCGHAIYIGKKM